ARHLHRQSRSSPRRAHALPDPARRGRETAPGERCGGAREALRRSARGARPMAEVLELQAARGARGTVRLPGSKSISNRVTLRGALAAGETEVSGLLDAEDTRVMREALERLDVRLTEHANGIHIRGAAGAFPETRAVVFIARTAPPRRPSRTRRALGDAETFFWGGQAMRERQFSTM